MAIDQFEKGSLYRHDLPGASLDVEVLQILSKNDSYWNMQVKYRKRWNGKSQLVFPYKTGSDAYIDTVNIGAEDLRYWTKLEKK